MKKDEEYEQPITAEEILALLSDKSDFRLEMEVVSAMRRRGLCNVEHGGTYIDRVTGKPRQFDARGVISFNDGMIKLAVECKALSKSFPLVVHRTRTLAPEMRYDLIQAHDLSTNSISSNTWVSSRISVYEMNGGTSILHDDISKLGRSCHQVGRKPDGSRSGNKIFSDDKDVYDKWAQAISSAHDLITEIMNIGVYSGRVLSYVIMPILVVPNDTLWCVDYDDDGSINEPQTSNCACLYIGRKFLNDGWKVGYSINYLRIFTISGFREFINSVSTCGGVIFDLSEGKRK